jgi:hypothetical protein
MQMHRVVHDAFANQDALALLCEECVGCRERLAVDCLARRKVVENHDVFAVIIRVGRRILRGQR